MYEEHKTTTVQEGTYQASHGAMVASNSNIHPHNVGVHNLSPVSRTINTTNYSNSQTMFNSMVPEGSRIVSTTRGEARETGETHIIASRMGEARFTGETNILSQHTSGSQCIGTTIVGIEKGVERQISVTEVAVGEEVIGEKTQLIGRGRRGRKVICEEVIEKIIIVPETVQIEEWVEDEYDIEETVVEVAKKYQIEKTVEVPEIEIVGKIIEKIETVVREKIVEVPKIETIEKIVEVPVIQTVVVIVEVPEISGTDY